AAARAQLENDWSALGQLSAEVEAAEAELERFERFQNLIERAHEVEMAPVVLDGAFEPGARAWKRSTTAARFLLEALRCYEVLERKDWNTALEGGSVGRDQVDQVRRAEYEELLWLAADVVGGQQKHWVEDGVPPEATARLALAYLGKAASAHPPTQ